MSIANELAYPGGNGGKPYADGLTKRELFAAMAMQGLLPLISPEQSPAGFMKQLRSIATDSVIAADALIAALSKEPKP